MVDKVNRNVETKMIMNLQDISDKYCKTQKGVRNYRAEEGK